MRSAGGRVKPYLLELVVVRASEWVYALLEGPHFVRELPSYMWCVWRRFLSMLVDYQVCRTLERPDSADVTVVLSVPLLYFDELRMLVPYTE